MQNISVLDLHIHSHYSIPSSKEMNIGGIYKHAVVKGVNVVGTSDILFPQWSEELKKSIEPKNDGTFAYKDILFILTSEVNLVFERFEKVRKVHLLLTFPDFKSVNDLSKALKDDLKKSARPTIHLDGKTFVGIVKQVNNCINIIPAHIWTPWFGLLGSFSGFENVFECFEDETKNILALETGLSSDPKLCYSVKSLRNFPLVSFSDAHSPSNIGREAVVLQNVKGYNEIFNSIGSVNDNFLMTIEEFPEYGKYFADGCRKCKYSTIDFKDKICPLCGRLLVIGVYHRIVKMPDYDDKDVVVKVPFNHTVPLRDVIAQAMHIGVFDKKVEIVYNLGIEAFLNELNVLVFMPLNVLQTVFPENVLRALSLLREERVKKIPGYDGVYGKIILGE
jgi:uncharacterized protein (TIGR00375 family)